ncbi:MAG: hypothetical protein ACJ73S_03130 [Mycobacteriales bacterium]
MTAVRSDDHAAGRALFAKMAALIGRVRRHRPESPEATATPAAGGGSGSALSRVATRPVTRVAAAAVLGAAVLAPTAGDGVLRVATGAHHHPAHALPVAPTDPGTDPGQDPGGPDDTLLPPYTPPYTGPDGSDQTPLIDSPNSDSPSTPGDDNSDQPSNHNGTPPAGGPAKPGGPTPPAPVPATWGFARVQWVDDKVGGTRDLAPSTEHPGNDEAGWTFGAWSLEQATTASAHATVTHLGTGQREVVLPKVGTAGGIVQAGVLDPNATGGTCQPVEWAPRGTDEAAKVFCFDAAGKPADLPFDLLFLAGDAGAGHSAGGQEGFVYAAQSTTSTAYTPDKGSERNAGTVTKAGTGKYTVALGKPGAESVQVSAVGSEARYCALTGLTATAATVSCRGQDGKAADTPFTLSYTGRQSLLDDVRTPDGAFLSAHTTADGTSGLSDWWQSRLGTPTIERTAAGRYKLTLPMGFPPAYAQVTDRGAAHCTLAPTVDATVYTVACFDPTAKPTDADFDLAYVTTAPTG